LIEHDSSRNTRLVGHKLRIRHKKVRILILEYCQGVDLLDPLRVKFLKVGGGKRTFMGVCGVYVGIFVSKSVITR
jgi:hypothetical protein